MIASLVIVAGAWALVVIVRDQLVAQSLDQNATYYWSQRALDPAHPPPDGVDMHGYAVADGGSAAGLPQDLRGLEPGLHMLDEETVLVDKRGDTRLYLTYPRDKATMLAFELVSPPVLLALIALAISAWFTYRMTRGMLTPLHWLAREVRRWDPMEPDTAALASDQLPPSAGDEVRLLAGALQRMGERMRAFVRRERDFTRDASHELRTPLTVIRVAADLLQSDSDLPQRAERSIARIQRAGRDMEAVIEAFLVLAREGNVEPAREDFAVRDVVEEEVQKVRPLLADRPVTLDIVERASPRLHASPRVLSVMLGNLLQNACMFTERGRIEVMIAGDRIAVTDTGIGMPTDVLQRAFDPFFRADPTAPDGKGMGLSIVRRLGERFGWPVTLESAPGKGTAAVIHFVARR
ncbi:MAG: HAMP domain-containing histidine kinase [Lysobacter sp.]|nr:HAMP domain-containing histidine kinase [Lysobacter sp.]